MNTLRLDISQTKNKEELKSFLEKENFKKGDTLQIIKDEETSDFELLGVLVVLIGIGLFLFYTAKERKKKSIPVTDSVEELEKFAETEASMKIDIDPQPSASNNNPFENSFGLWKNYKEDNETIRKRSWQRKK